LRRRLGLEGTRAVATSASLSGALTLLGSTAYGREVRDGMDLATAQHAVSATVLWHVRVLAGWSPPFGAEPLRLLAGGYEISNIVGHLARLSGEPGGVPYALGSLATAWPVVSAARTPAEVRAALARSAWGDPGTEDLPTIRLALQLAWARRVLHGAPGAADWAITNAALLIARVLATGAGAALPPGAIRDATRLLGPNWSRATSPSALESQVPRAAALAIADTGGPAGMWRAEAGWWSAVESSAGDLATANRPDASACIGVTALLYADAWRVRAALAFAGHPEADVAEVLDGVA